MYILGIRSRARRVTNKVLLSRRNDALILSISNGFHILNNMMSNIKPIRIVYMSSDIAMFIVTNYCTDI